MLSYELDLLPQSIWHLVSATAEAKANFVYLQEVGHFYAQKKYYTLRQDLDSFLIKYTISGCGLLEYGGHTEKAGPGHMFWIDCMNRQHYRTCPASGHWEVAFIHFKGATVRSYYNAFNKSQNGVPVKKLPEGSQMHNLFGTLLSRISTGEAQSSMEQYPEDIQISSILTQIMTEAVSPAENGGHSVRVPPIIQEIRNYLSANYDQKITLEHLSNKYSLDPFYLQKLFKRHIGQSPSQYIIHLRLTRAKTLMRTTDQSISEIAYAVGIDNISHFTRQFKKLEGITPLQYRTDWRVHR